MPTTNLDNPATTSQEDASKAPANDFSCNQAQSAQSVAVKPGQAAHRATSNCCPSQLHASRCGEPNPWPAQSGAGEQLSRATEAQSTHQAASDATTVPGEGAERDYKQLSALNAHQTCSPHFKMLSFLIPFVAVSMMFSCGQNCAVTAIVAGLLAGGTSRIIYGTIKRIRHRH